MQALLFGNLTSVAQNLLPYFNTRTNYYNLNCFSLSSQYHQKLSSIRYAENAEAKCTEVGAKPGPLQIPTSLPTAKS